MIAKRRDVQEKPREKVTASRSDGSGTTSKRKGSASLSDPRVSQVMTHSLGSEKKKPDLRGSGN